MSVSVALYGKSIKDFPAISRQGYITVGNVQFLHESYLNCFNSFNIVLSLLRA